MKTIIDAHPLFADLLNIWRAAQDPLYRVKRWGDLPQKYKGLYCQSTLEHVYAITVLLDIVILTLSPRKKIDSELLHRAIRYHDFSEGLLGRDVMLPNKNHHKDLEEYEAMKEKFSPLGAIIWTKIEEAYLLQFALQRKPCFPQHAQIIMRRLCTKKRVECLLFYAIEVLDYILYPLSHTDAEIAPEFFAHVLEGNCPKLDALAKAIPEFGEKIWLPAISAAATDFALKHRNDPFRPISKRTGAVKKLRKL